MQGYLLHTPGGSVLETYQIKWTSSAKKDFRKIIFIGGTGNISMACSRHAVAPGIELYHLYHENTDADIPGNVNKLNGDYKKQKPVEKRNLKTSCIPLKQLVQQDKR